MTPTPPKPTARQIDRALRDHYEHLLERPIPCNIEQVLVRLRDEQKALEPEV